MVPPGVLTVALVLLSTAATVIASQALISGAFSMSHQAIQLGFLPRLRVKHTSKDEEGQVYVPAVNFVPAINSLTFSTRGPVLLEDCVLREKITHFDHEDAFGHLKAIGVDRGGQWLLKSALVENDAGICGISDTKAFIAAAKTRQWVREASVRTLA